MTKKEFDAAVKDLRGKVVPKKANKKKTDCTPEEWAANLDYGIGTNRKYSAANPEKRRSSVQAWRANNPDKALEIARQYRSSNRIRHNEKARRWAANNHGKVIESVRKWAANARKSNPDFKLRCDLRIRLNRAVKGGYKQGSAVRDMGCTIAEFWAHMEPQFQPGMTRENMGKAWEIDHIYPLSKADLTGSRTEFLAANNWRNLQPLTPPQNNAKGDTVTPEAQVLFDQLKAEFAREIYAESA
jgi:hypothetical protein